MSDKNRLSRRSFLQVSLAAGASTLLPAPGVLRAMAGVAAPAAGALPHLAVVKGDSPAQNTMAALEAIGGIQRFVRPGQKVVIKPNPIGDSPPEQALNTHPDMVETVVRECLRVGAEKVTVISFDSLRGFQRNGLAGAIERAGGTVHALENPDDFRDVIVPRGRILRRERIAAEIVESDVFINMPIAKHHAGSQVTLSMKNLMGINWDRINYHRTDLHQCIAELTATVPQHLILMDANHVLLTNGPAGPGEVLRARQVIAGTDPVAVDAFTTRAFFGEQGQVRHIQIAHELGVGEIDLAKLRIKEVEA